MRRIVWCTLSHSASYCVGSCYHASHIEYSWPTDNSLLISIFFSSIFYMQHTIEIDAIYMKIGALYIVTPWQLNKCLYNSE